ncbi:Anaphase-promoting complex subunit CDC26 [Penicillium nucicola]|uniref:Anaphase-promoting complex subunit CDC26 n=1 Tax=Penicillium nucicola TaxID=1850975 RepID=UPI0025455286|nr:Anaphase-promoting complex subunit CDC26 [Penicillium nucicola]KAJ5753853.1 Anaphase-promoting complex subunit CDC26 [Penicillium nucicola]
MLTYLSITSVLDSAAYALTVKMLRRKPTAIAVTSEDLAAFEEARLRKLSEENKHPEQHAKGSSNANFDPSDELKPLPGDKARIVRSREERIGIGRRG